MNKQVQSALHDTLVIDGHRFQSNVAWKQKMRRDVKLLYDVYVMADTME